MFQRYSRFSKWPLSILLQMFFLRRHFIRQFCCYCNKNFEFVRSSRSGDSGGICHKCLFENHRELYDDLKKKGQLTQQQIAEAEGP